jgi:flagellar basal body-associated protein FliL
MRKFRKLAALCAVFLIALCLFSTAAYAAPEDESTTTPAESTAAPTESATATDNNIGNILPPGTGTVVDVFEGEDGRKFYTIQTPAGNTFYLIIDFTMTGENVYFVDAVQEKDLIALAEKAANGQTGGGGVTSTASNNSTSEQPDGNQETPAPAANSGNNFMILLIVLIVVIGGGAGYYFKVYRKKRDNDSRDEYEDEPDDYAGEDYETEPEDDSVPWEEDEEDV